MGNGEPGNFRTTLERADVFDAVAAGGYPAALRRTTPAQRTRWFSSYLATVTDRDLPDLIDVRHSGALSRLYRLIAKRTSSTVVNTELSQVRDVTQPTASSYRRLLERLYLTTELRSEVRSSNRSSYERPDGSAVAVEVKSARSVNRRDASGLTFLRDRLGDRFQCGILFHTGPLTARLGERVWAVPVAALWDGVSRPKDSLEDGRS